MIDCVLIQQIASTDAFYCYLSRCVGAISQFRQYEGESHQLVLDWCQVLCNHRLMQNHTQILSGEERHNLAAIVASRIGQLNWSLEGI